MAKYISKLTIANQSGEDDVYDLKDKIVRSSIGVGAGQSVGQSEVSLGIASLDTTGKVPSSQIPASAFNLNWYEGD